MTCYHPLDAFQTEKDPTTGKRKIYWNAKDVGGRFVTCIKLPCGQCIGCRIDRSKAWAVRCVHEKSLYKNNCFVTLTYNDENLPAYGSLDKRDFVLFMKRLRRNFSGAEKVIDDDGRESFPIRFFHCGEYGSKLSRPHHHVCLFNFRPEDLELWNIRKGVELYRSRSLELLWSKGFVTVGDVTVESAAYVARYITKKINGERATEHYTRISQETGEIYQLEPEYITMSRRPGIGRNWFRRYPGDVFPKDFVTIKGRKYRTPRYYDGIYDCMDPEGLETVKCERTRRMRDREQDRLPSRLRAMERVAKAALKAKVRSIEV